MINLLAPADKQALAQEYRRHKLTVAAVLWFLVGAAALIVFASLYIILELDRHEVATRLAEAKTAYQAVASTTSERLIINLNQQASLLLTPSPLGPTMVLERLVALRPTGVLLERISYRWSETEGLIELGGRANARQDFLRLLGNFQADPTFSTVDSPVENLIRERNVIFRLTLHLKP